MSEVIDRGVLAGTGYDRSTQYEDLGALASAILAQQETKRDYIVDTRTMTFSTEDAMSTLTFDNPDGGIDGGPVNDHAHGQLAARLGIPVKYYRRMQTEYPALLDQNVGGWFIKQPERRMVRMLDGRVRAVLSDRYRKLDNIDLMEHAVIPTLGDTPGLHFQVASLTPEKLHINALLPGLAAEIKRGDVVQAGVSIHNSEVGNGALKVQPRVWRLACLNGLLVDALALSKYHVGRTADEDAYAVYTDETMKADDHAFFLKVRDVVKAALSESTFATIVEQLQRTTDPSAQIQNPVMAAERLADRYDLDGGEQASLLRHLATGGDLTQWGAINAVTAAAKSADTFDRQADMEAVGGRLAGMDAREWAAVAAA